MTAALFALWLLSVALAWRLGRGYGRDLGRLEGAVSAMRRACRECGIPEGD